MKLIVSSISKYTSFTEKVSSGNGEKIILIAFNFSIKSMVRLSAESLEYMEGGRFWEKNVRNNYQRVWRINQESEAMSSDIECLFQISHQKFEINALTIAL